MSVCLSVEQPVTEKDRQRNLCYLFQVSPGARRLAFRFSYSPKRLEDEEGSRERILAALRRDLTDDACRKALPLWRRHLPLNNLLTLSLDHGDDYIGCAHRHDPEQEHIVSPDFASPGFVPCPSLAGEWRAVVSIHELVTPDCVFRLDVTEEGSPHGMESL